MTFLIFVALGAISAWRLPHLLYAGDPGIHCHDQVYGFDYDYTPNSSDEGF